MIVVIDAIVGSKPPIADGICRKPIRSECFAFALERKVSNNFRSRADIVDQSRLDVIFASEAVRVKRDLVIQAAPLA